MAIVIERHFAPTDRYYYDFRECTVAKGWAQVDTDQDAHYFGTWVNPTEFRILQYCEGDVIQTRCDSALELAAEIERMKVWNEEQGHRFIGIDPGFSVALKAACIRSGLITYLH